MVMQYRGVVWVFRREIYVRGDEFLRHLLVTVENEHFDRFVGRRFSVPTRDHFLGKFFEFSNHFPRKNSTEARWNTGGLSGPEG